MWWSGRVVKALCFYSKGLRPRGFESHPHRDFFEIFFLIEIKWDSQGFLPPRQLHTLWRNRLARSAVNRKGFEPTLERKISNTESREKYCRIRTCNPLIRSQMPYPLGHRASCQKLFQYGQVVNVSADIEMCAYLQTGRWSRHSKTCTGSLV